jgi:hypothetical protein
MSVSAPLIGAGRALDLRLTISQGSPVISLRERLRQSSRQWPIVKTISDRWFVPQASLEELITPTSILAELRKPGHPSATIQDDIPSKVHLQYHRTALRLFAILALINKTDSIHDLVREGISDKQLPLNQYVATQPLTRDSIRLCTKGKPDRPILGMASWDTTDFENFYREQWSVFAPVFEKKNEPYHYFFHDKQILPYTFDAKMGRKLHGVHGDVWKIDIHPAHQRAIDLELVRLCFF